MTASTRQQWKSPNEFLFASIGMIVGLSNLLRFPFVVYNNGGLVFMMVYVLLMAVVAVPMTYLEIFLGQFSSCTGPGAFRGFPMAKGIAWSMLYVNLSSCVSYMNTVVHAFFYLFYSFSPTLPWISCNNSWSDANCFIMDYRIVPCFRINATLARKYASSNYTEKDALAVPSIGPGNSSVMVPASEYDAMRSTCLNATQTSTEQFLLKKILRLTSGIEEIGTLHWDVLLVIGIFWLAGFFTISKGIRSFAKVALCTSYTTYALLLVLLLSSVVQRGSIRGLAAYFSPDWEKLLDLMTWRAASQQLLFSMGLALGTLTCYGSYKRFQWPLSMKILTLTGADFLFSFFSGCMAFALHGHATVLYGMELGDVVTSGHTTSIGRQEDATFSDRDQNAQTTLGKSLNRTLLQNGSVGIKSQL
ncbi:creatine transporter-like [Amblyomma americanum]